MSFPEKWPAGLIRRVDAEIAADAITLGGGSGISGGQKKLTRAFTFGSELHGCLFPQVPGDLWHDFLTAVEHSEPAGVDPSASGFRQVVTIPLALLGTLRARAFRANDTSMLNLNNRAKPSLDIVLGPITDLVSGGSNPACSGTVTLVIEYEPNPAPGKYNPAEPMKSGDEPGLQIEIIPAYMTTLDSKPERALAVGDGRRLFSLYAREENNGTTPPTPVTDIFNGTGTGLCEFRMKYGTDAIVDDVPLGAFDRFMQKFLDVTFRTGGHLYLPIKDGRTGDAINVSDSKEFYIRLSNPQTTASRQVALLGFYAKPVKGGASYAEQAAPR